MRLAPRFGIHASHDEDPSVICGWCSATIAAGGTRIIHGICPICRGELEHGGLSDAMRPLRSAN